MAAQSLVWLEAVCLCICLVLADAVESPNVQRLSASRRHRSRSIPTSMSISEVEAPETVVASFASQLKGSKNNPETDWKNDVAELAKKSQSNEHFTDLELDFMSGGLVKTPNSFQWLVDLYDPLRWTKLPGRLNSECARQMGEFIDALWKGEPWAAKSE
ncbi:hypothetical protein QAD02_016583 [Eretmocerus hayati]|uniref:Uncharacterized protein n=1 Tax=Eretmocerus hayati TaxID=131215 RepID=A0ACC2PBH4_9HYME|nr:hypothetical protein QAD02_016583 [Eretmocerus hayati]